MKKSMETYGANLYTDSRPFKFKLPDYNIFWNFQPSAANQ